MIIKNASYCTKKTALLYLNFTTVDPLMLKLVKFTTDCHYMDSFIRHNVHIKMINDHKVGNNTKKVTTYTGPLIDWHICKFKIYVHVSI